MPGRAAGGSASNQAHLLWMMRTSTDHVMGRRTRPSLAARWMYSMPRMTRRHRGICSLVGMVRPSSRCLDRTWPTYLVMDSAKMRVLDHTENAMIRSSVAAAGKPS